ncbi:hypothetical protein [Burkholderia aenigmatica]|uniref:hypothetical protein n=1 Tax=Burkholderia aenigmatica TaxID=2015348 RepID=UPI00265163AC|nr:hypothetical protein [Burkholderia aenigmatica]MDN7880074.1 hypothetical protein [Burkholderia aenigmatica]
MSVTVSTAVRWVGRNFGLTLALASVGLVLGAIEEAREVSASAYSIIDENWSKLTPATQRVIVEKLDAHGGKLRKWDYYPDLLDAVVTDTQGFVLPTTGEDAQPARERLIHTIRASGKGRG